MSPITHDSPIVPYDAAYVALAETLRAELVTLDARMEKVPGLMCTVRNLRS